MRTIILFLICLIGGFFQGSSQEVVNNVGGNLMETIRQISPLQGADQLNIQTFRQPDCGNGNLVSITQLGYNNRVLTVQQGSCNMLSLTQIGYNNGLVAWQVGESNWIDGYTQQNYSENSLCDRLVQVGEFLHFDARGLAGSGWSENRVTQIGNNLSFQINAVLPGSGEGIKVTQTGKDMRVVIEQSYFSFPLR